MLSDISVFIASRISPLDTSILLLDLHICTTILYVFVYMLTMEGFFKTFKDCQSTYSYMRNFD